MRAQRDFWLDLLCPQAHFPNVKTVMGHVKQFAGEWWKDRIEPIGLSTTFHFWKTPPFQFPSKTQMWLKSVEMIH